MDTRKEQIITFNQDLSIDDKSLKFKIYNYFYLLLKTKKEFNTIILSILIVLETIQFISYAFTEPHLNSWKIDKKIIDIISVILGSTRISPLMKYISFNNYLIVSYCLLGLIFIYYIIILFHILTNTPSTKNIVGISLIKISINVGSVFLYIPITELLLLPIKCKDGNIELIFDSDQQKCGEGFYYLYVVLGIIGTVLLFILILFFLNFYFYPFYESNLNRKLNTSNDIALHFIKLIFILINIFITDEYLSVAILLICSFFMVIKEFYEDTYCNEILKIIINIRNITSFWTYFILLLSKICYNSNINGAIYLLFFSYPLIIYFSALKIKREEITHFLIPIDINDINYLLHKTRILIKMIESEIQENNNLNKSNNKKKKKTEIFLYGYIKMHVKDCQRLECPLTKYLENSGNYNFQKQCLLSYMSIHFNTVIKHFPKNSLIRIYYIHFNYTKRYNLNSVRINLAELKKLKVNYQEEFVIFCLEQEIKEIDSKVTDFGANGDHFDSELIDQKYLKLKYLIENTTKLYVEFWSIFSGNITNLNTNKLNTLGTKLNNYLKEIKNIWENELKNINTDLEHQGIVLLYSKFLKEILWNKKKSEEISKKLNTEHYFRHDSRKAKSGKKSKMPNIDSVIENQEFLIFANSNEKGLCKIVQCSYNILYFLGYEKKEIIRRPIEILMPSIFIEGHKKMLEEKIKKMISSQSSLMDSSNNSNQKQNFILLRNKIGYLLPMNTSFKIYDDSDYSNTYIIKGKMEPKDSKSVYAFYILTKPDFTIDSISSSALNLGLTMDLLKKYLVKMNLLIRTKDDEPINLFERYQEFEDEPKQILWVYPHIIYPKDNNQRNKEVIIHELINQSPKGRFLLQINTFRYTPDKIIGFSFKITDIVKKKEKTNINFSHYIPSSNNEVMFDLLNLNYIRTIVVKHKSGLRNLRDLNKEEDSVKKSVVSKKKKKKAKKEGIVELMNDSSNEENNKEEVILSKEKILELQEMDSNYIKNYIFSLPFNGNDVSLEKHRPNKEKYMAGKTTEPRIKIVISQFIKRMEDKILSDPNLLKKLKKTSIASNKLDENIPSNDYLTSPLSPKKEINKEEIGRQISDVSSILSKLFDNYALHLFAVVNFCIYAYIILLSTIEFIFTYRQINKFENNLDYFKKGTELMNIMLYTKFFITESVIANKLNETNTKYLGLEDKDLGDFNDKIKKELSEYHKRFSEIYNDFSSNLNKFSKEYQDYMNNKNMTFYSIANDIPLIESKLFSATLNKIPSSLFYVSTVLEDNEDVLTMDMRNIYELMMNLLNGYTTNWKNVTYILYWDTKRSTEKIISSLIILIITIFLDVIFVYIYYKVLVNISINTEKPINLILTIKKKIFEDLKNSAENFANKLLNKFFGNEENEEESQQDYQTNLQPNDINIVKFKSPSNASYSCLNFWVKIVQLILFLGVVETYFIFKYVYSMDNFKNMIKFLDVYGITESTDSDIISNIDIVKSFLYNDTIPINEKDSVEPFINVFYSISDYIEQTIIETSKTESFLKAHYRKDFIGYLYSDFSALIQDDIDITQFKDDLKNGFRPILSDIYEIIIYFEYLYLSNETYYSDTRVNTTCSLINHENWIYLNSMVKNILRNFFKEIEDILYNMFENYIKKAKVVHTIIFIVLQCLLLIYYIIIWRRYYITVKIMIKKSQELINLIPEEIKYIMVEKINE